MGATEAIAAPGDVRAALRRATDDFCTVLTAAARPDIAVPGSEWTVGEVGVHVALGTEAYVGYVRGATEPFVDVSDIAGGSLARTSAARIDADPERDLTTLASRVRAASSTLLAATDERDLRDVVVWNDLPLALGDLLGIGLAEYLLHGRDIANALSKPWTISADDARLVLAAALPLLPLLIDPTTTAHARARYDLRVRGGERVALTIADGSLTVGQDVERVDCHVSAEPVALLLVAYGRCSQWVPILTGKLLAWGRKPWLGTRLVRYLVTP